MSEARITLLVSETKSILTESLVDGKLSTNEILNIAMFVAQKVSSIANLSYDEKKTLVIKVVEASLQQHLTPSQFDQVGARAALDMLPTVFDIAMNVASGKLDLSVKGLEKVASSCLPSCFSFLKKVAPTEVPLKKNSPAEVLLKKVAESVATVSPDVVEVKVESVLPNPLVSHVSSAVASYVSTPVAVDLSGTLIPA
jgi:hypothetical protein